MKIAIIGAGPGGLYAALTAVRQNIQVDLLEKRKIGEGIVCGECIIDSLGIMAQPGKGLLHPVKEIILQGQGQYVFPLGRYRDLWMLDRQSWQTELADLAKKRGVAISESTKITAARLRQMQKEYDWIIDASGAPSVTARAYQFAAEYYKEYLLAHQIVLAGDFSALMPRIKFAFFPDIPADFQPSYYWIFPKNAGQANVGVVCKVCGTIPKGRLNLKELLSAVLHREGLNVAGMIKKGSGFVSTRMLPQLIYGNIILVGDAAGLASALHGGGIDMACLSGVLAVEAAGNGIRAAANYRKKLLSYISEKLAWEKVTIKKMATMNSHRFDNLLSGITSQNKFTRLNTALHHPDMFYGMIKWFGTKKPRPDWPL